MLILELKKAELKKVGDHQYYVFPMPPTHKNQKNRPTQYVDEDQCTRYTGRGSNGSAKLHPDVHTPADALMRALFEYGESISDNSILSAVIQSGWRADDASQGAKYLSIIKDAISNNKKIFGTLTFPSDLEEDAKGVLGSYNDPRRVRFRNDVANSPGWDAKLMQQLFYIVDNRYAPRGSNPHSTGFVFDLNFSIYYCQYQKVKKGNNQKCVDGEMMLNANTYYNSSALRSAAGMWINQYAMQFNFDSYDTGKEVWHLEYRKPK